MKISINFLVLSLLAVSLFIETANGAGQLHQICSNQTYTLKSNYEENLNTVLDDLKSKTAKTGFSLSTAGESPDLVFGLAQCRGDASNADCQGCISTATSHIRDLCVTTNTASIWYDQCFLRYSNAQISNILDMADGLVFRSTGEVKDTNAFFANARDLFTNLSKDASDSPKYFASGETKDGTSPKIYGSIDCTRDLSIDHRKRCLDTIVGLLTSDHTGDGNVGRIVTASCTLRYDTFSFFNATH